MNDKDVSKIILQQTGFSEVIVETVKKEPAAETARDAANGLAQDCCII